MTLALIGALAIGITLGLIGSGGSVLTVPVLILILQRPEKLAIAESLAIVGLVALIGALPYIFRSQVKWNAVLFFGLPSFFGACLGGCGPYFFSGSTQVTLFAFIAMGIGFLMLFNQPMSLKKQDVYLSKGTLVVGGFAVGSLTGFLGIGGGFVIVPCLVLFFHLSMSYAIGTSLVIISINSFTAFLNQFYFLSRQGLSVDMQVIAVIAFAGAIGSLFGGCLSQYISQFYLRISFGLIIIVLGFYLISSKNEKTPERKENAWLIRSNGLRELS